MAIIKVDYGEVGGGISITDADFQYKPMSSSPTTFNLSDNSKIYLCFVGRTAAGYESQTYASIIKDGTMKVLHNSLPSQYYNTPTFSNGTFSVSYASGSPGTQICIVTITP